MTQVTVQKHGDSISVSIPRDIQSRMGLEAGQQLILIEMYDGLKIVKYSADLQEQLDVARQVLRDQSDVLQALAEYDRG